MQQLGELWRPCHETYFRGLSLNRGVIIRYLLEGYEDSVRDGNGLLKSLMIHACKEYKRNNDKKETARAIHCVTQPYLNFLNITSKCETKTPSSINLLMFVIPFPKLGD